MSRLARVVVAGIPQHVTQRGNGRAQVFFSDQDRERYLALFGHYQRCYGLRTLAYCLMDNHVHWVVVPDREPALAETLREAHARYAAKVNAIMRRPGHLFQGRFFSCPLDDQHLWAAVRYVERNPVRAGIVAQAEEYRWSSAAAHCAQRTDRLLAAGFPPAGVVGNWSEWLRQEEDACTRALRRNTLTGRPCGGPGFVMHLETLTGRILQPLKRGRKSRLAVPEQGHLFS